MNCREYPPLIVRPYERWNTSFMAYHDVCQKLVELPTLDGFLEHYYMSPEEKGSVAHTKRSFERMKVNLRALGFPIVADRKSKKDSFEYSLGVPLNDALDYLDRLFGISPYPLPSRLPLLEQEALREKVKLAINNGTSVEIDTTTPDLDERMRVVVPMLAIHATGPRRINSLDYQKIGLKVTPAGIKRYTRFAYPWLDESILDDECIITPELNHALHRLLERYHKSLPAEGVMKLSKQYKLGQSQPDLEQVA